MQPCLELAKTRKHLFTQRLRYQNLIKQADLERYKNITSRNKNVTEITTQWMN